MLENPILYIILFGLAAAALIVWNRQRTVRKAAPDQAHEARKQTPTPEELQACFSILEQTVLPYLKLAAVRKPVGLYDSKFGGIPYLPPDFAYPHNENPQSDRKPLKLLAQINFEQLSPLPKFPKEGILQFYISYESSEDMYGLDLNNGRSQAAWRVVYHKDIIKDESLLQNPPELPKDKNEVFPFDGEFALIAEANSMPVTDTDFRWQDFWENVFMADPVCKQLCDKYTDDDIRDALVESMGSNGHRMGGYPVFTQSDPREWAANEQHTVLLLQIDSQSDNSWEIIWGDAGVANFFITPDALEKCDFSDVLYNWDCC